MAIVGGCSKSSDWWSSFVTKVQRCSVFLLFVFVFVNLQVLMLLLLVVGGLVVWKGGVGIIIDGNDGSLLFFWMIGVVKV